MSYNNAYGINEDGKIAVRIMGVGGSGGGAVSSVNGKTGAVVLDANDVGAIPQYSSMPEPNQAGDIVQYIGTTNQNYTNGYFYKSVSEESGVGSGTATVTEFDGGDDDVDLPAPTFTFNVNTFNSYVTALNKAEIIERALEIDIADNGSDFFVEVHYNNGDESFTAETATQSMSDLESTLASFGVSVDLTGFTWVTMAYLELPTATEYVWERVDVQPTPVIPDPLPSQTGQSGKFLTTDGTDASWSDKPVINRATGVDALAMGTAGTSATNLAGIAMGQGAVCTGERAMQFGYGTNNENNTMKVSLGYQSFTNYKLLDSDGTIPADRLVHAINKYSSMPTAASTNEGWIIQYTGATDSTYTHGYIYECVSDGGNPATYSWSAINVQAGGATYGKPANLDPNDALGFWQLYNSDADWVADVVTESDTPSENDPVYIYDATSCPPLRGLIYKPWTSQSWQIPVCGWIRISRYDSVSGRIYLKDDLGEIDYLYGEVFEG